MVIRAGRASSATAPWPGSASRAGCPRRGTGSSGRASWSCCATRWPSLWCTGACCGSASSTRGRAAAPASTVSPSVCVCRRTGVAVYRPRSDETRHPRAARSAAQATAVWSRTLPAPNSRSPAGCGRAGWSPWWRCPASWRASSST